MCRVFFKKVFKIEINLLKKRKKFFYLWELTFLETLHFTFSIARDEEVKGLKKVDNVSMKNNHLPT